MDLEAQEPRIILKLFSDTPNPIDALIGHASRDAVDVVRAVRFPGALQKRIGVPSLRERASVKPGVVQSEAIVEEHSVAAQAFYEGGVRMEEDSKTGRPGEAGGWGVCKGCARKAQGNAASSPLPSHCENCLRVQQRASGP